MQHGALPHINALKALSGVEARAHWSLARPVQGETRASTDSRRQAPQRLDDGRVEAAPPEGRAHRRLLEGSIGIVGEVLKPAAPAGAEVGAGGRPPPAPGPELPRDGRAAPPAGR